MITSETSERYTPPSAWCQYSILNPDPRTLEKTQNEENRRMDEKILRPPV